MTSQVYYTTPALTVPTDFDQACILNQPLVQALRTRKVLLYRYYCITMKVSYDFISKLDTVQKTQSLYEKRRIVPKRKVFISFSIVNRGGE